MNCSTLISPFHILFFFLCIYHFTAAGLAIEALDNGDDDICKKVDCGQGECVPSNTSFLGIKGFDCVCKPGWQKAQLGPIILPACTVPNCTINFQCGNGLPSLPPAIPQPSSILNPCAIVWCGDGNCVVNGIGYYCKCNEGSENLFNMSGVACFKDCTLGADCAGVLLGPPVTPPPPPSYSSGNTSGSPPSTPQPSVNGTGHILNCSRNFGQVNLLLLSLVLLLTSI